MSYNKLNFLDLFAGAGGLSEGFIHSGFQPIAHVESDQAACYTLRTRMAYHWLNANKNIQIYIDYLNSKLTRDEFYSHIPKQILESVLEQEIGRQTISDIFSKIDSILGKRKLDLIIGGPPCQAYSLVGRSRDQNRMHGDKRNYLYTYYAEFLKRYKPTYFVFENVTGLLSAKDGDGHLYLSSMIDLFYECGYITEYKILSAEDYGVLQKRRRIILVGKRGKSSNFYPEPEKWAPEVKVSEVFNDLPHLHAGEGSLGPCKLRKYNGTWQIQAGIRNDEIPVTLHQARNNNEQDLEIYRIAVELWNREKRRLDYNTLPDYLKSHNNKKSFLDRFKVVAKNLPYSQTVMAHIAKDGHYYIHPDIRQNRSITPREAARLQTFPDDYYFESYTDQAARTSAFRQIGNAVPVLLAKKIANKLREIWQ